MLHAILLIGLFYHPSPAPDFVWSQYRAVVDDYNGRVEQRETEIGRLQVDVSACVDQFSGEADGVRKLVNVDLYAIARVYEMYGIDELAPKRFDQKKEEYTKAADKLFKEFDKCVAKATGKEKDL